MRLHRRLLLLTVAAAGLFAIVPASASAVCFGQAPTITGTGAGETIPGTAGDDVIEAGAGNDIVNGGGGVDRICGEGDNDTINGQGGNDQLDGGETGTDVDTVTFVDLTVGQGPSLTVDLVLGTAIATSPINTTDTLTGFENVTGSTSFDFLLGDAGPNTLEGLGSADGFTGRGGNDTLTDLTDGPDFVDTALYPDATGAIQADLGAGTVVTPNVGTDTLAGVPGVDGTGFNDTFTGNAAFNVFNGLGGDDQFTPLGGDDQVTGGAGNADSISYASEGALQMDLTDNSIPNVTTAAGDDFVDQVENVTGSPAGDTIIGNASSNVINGLGGDDDIDGGPAGTDTASFATLGQGVVANLNAGTSTGQGTDTLTNIDNLTGSSEGDSLTGDGAPNTLDGLGSGDNLEGLGGNDTLSDPAGGDLDSARYENSPGPGGIVADLGAGTVDGTAAGAGSDTLSGVFEVSGTQFDDVMTGDGNPNGFTGRSGNDRFAPLGGADSVNGVAGTDTITYAAETGPIVTADLSSGNLDNVTAPGGDDTVFGVENLIGSPQNDSIASLGSEDNVLEGRAGDDDLIGGPGSGDTVSYATLAGPLGVNVNLALETAVGEGADELVSIENVTGSPQGDVLFGDGNTNVLAGLAGNDSLDGQADPDILLLGPGTDNVGASDGEVDSIDCTGGGPDSGSVDGPAPAETYTGCDTDGDAVVDFLDACPTQANATANGCPLGVTPPAQPPTTAPSPPAGKKCKKGFVKKKVKGKTKCVKKKRK